MHVTLQNTAVTAGYVNNPFAESYIGSGWRLFLADRMRMRSRNTLTANKSLDEIYLEMAAFS